MKSKYLIFCIAFLVPVMLFGQGNSLRFNRVIDTVLVAEITSCVDLTTNGYSGFAITVPQNCVWKVESMGPLHYNSSSTLHIDCSNSNNYASNSMMWGIRVDDGSTEKGYLKRRFYSGSWVSESIDGTAWLRAGTSLYSHMVSSYASYKHTYYASSSAPFFCRIHLTIIEFLVVPN